MVHVLLQESTSSSSSGGYHWSTIIPWVSASIALAGLLVALFFQRRQLNNANAALNDRRFDERFDAKFGANFQNITKLMEETRTTLNAAEKSAAAVQETSEKAERITETIQEQARKSDEGREKLDDALRRANEVIRQLDQRVQKANADAEAISEARSSVARQMDVISKISNVLAAHSYKPRAEVNIDGKPPAIDMFADGGRAMPSLVIEIKFTAEMGVMRSGVAQLIAVRHEKEAKLKAAFHVDRVMYLLILAESDRPVPEELLSEAQQQGISILRVQDLNVFIENLPTLDQNEHNVKESE